MSAAIRGALRAVADTRADAYAATEALKSKRAQFEADNAALLEHEKKLKAAVAVAEANARALVLVHYEATRDQAPMAGVTVKLFKTITYDATRALAWAKEKGMALIPEQLDVKAFEKIAAVTTLDFVVKGTEPRVTLATHLDPATLTEPATEEQTTEEQTV